MIKNIKIVLVGLMLFGCIDPHKIEIEATKSYYIINGTISNSFEPQTISIFKTNDASKFKSSQFTSTISPKATDVLPVAKGKVQIIENETNTFDLIETEPGYYITPNGFFGKIGATYKLLVTLADGNKFESSVEKMLPVTEIKSYFDTFNEAGIVDKQSSSGKISTNDVYIDFDDPASEANFYQWKWTTYETQVICKSCRQGFYDRPNNDLATKGVCLSDVNLPIDNYFDYYCQALCWDLIISNKIDIFSDVYTNGLPQKSKLVAQVPLLQSNPCLVVLEQFSLNANAFRYLKLINDQSVNTGTLADTPPAPIKGNVSNKANPSEIILGYFTASAIAEQRIWLDRKNARGAAYNGIFKYKNNRTINPEEPNLSRPFIPLAVCEPSNSRTPIAPKGWRFGQN